MISHRVREYREKAGLSQTELARRVYIACTNLSAIECGRLAPWPKVRRALAEVLDVSENDLFPVGGEPSQDSKPDYPSEPLNSRKPL